MRISFLFFLLLFSIASVSLGADTGVSVEDTIFIPREYYVGDEVELRIKLKIEEGFNLYHPLELPESSWIKINSLEITGDQKSPELRIVFTSFIPGTRSFPPLNLGEIVLNSVKIHTSSLIDSTGENFIGIAGQLLLPGTKLGLSIIVGSLFTGPLLLIILLGPLKRKLVFLIKNGLGRSPINKLNRVLKELGVQKNGISCRRFYIRLSGAVREYLSKRSDIDFITLTTSDMELALIKVIGHREFSSMLSDMMKLSDNIKFGKVTTDDKKKIDDIELVMNISKFLELKIKGSNNSRSTS
ncbi:MAG: hypothetical protein U9N32_08010 [Spirochaetota bacterium]|nr:hypothetical protein [Spirochaetota bacterium]